MKRPVCMQISRLDGRGVALIRLSDNGATSRPENVPPSELMLQSNCRACKWIEWGHPVSSPNVSVDSMTRPSKRHTNFELAHPTMLG
ncbi:hypothetical protein D918_04403 [Trichuris suis]|nr:hypothetical protein D918_04403 [Trichuris suis]